MWGGGRRSNMAGRAGRQQQQAMTCECMHMPKLQAGLPVDINTGPGVACNLPTLLQPIEQAPVQVPRSIPAYNSTCKPVKRMQLHNPTAPSCSYNQSYGQVSHSSTRIRKPDKAHAALSPTISLSCPSLTDKLTSSLAHSDLGTAVQAMLLAHLQQIKDALQRGQQQQQL